MKHNQTGATPNPLSNDYVDRQLRRKRRQELLICWLVTIGLIGLSWVLFG